MRFQAGYNDERPHAALDNATPAERYAPSQRRWDGILRHPEPPAGAVLRRVRRNGVIKWQCAEVFVGEALIGEPVALLEAEDDRWTVAFDPLWLGVLVPSGRRLQRPRKSAVDPGENAPRCPQGPRPTTTAARNIGRIVSPMSSVRSVNDVACCTFTRPPGRPRPDAALRSRPHPLRLRARALQRTARETQCVSSSGRGRAG